MNYGTLSTHFVGVATKELTLVDTKGSNQHEVGGPKYQWNRFRQILGEEPRLIKEGTGIPTRYIYISAEQESIDSEGYCTWYDTRHKDEKRSAEWRVYYQSNDVTAVMEPGDQLVLAKRREDYLLFIVIAEDSGLVNRILYLFGMDSQTDEVALQDFSETDPELDFLNRLILEEIGIEFENPDANSLDAIIEPFGLEFPGTREFSDLARQTLPEISALDDPDWAIISWLDHEEALFRRLEARIVSEEISTSGLMVAESPPDVDKFISLSLSVHNRRKSRMGHSLENHLAAVFDAYSLRYDVQKKTEKGKKPDFLFPGIDEYNDNEFSVSFLTMLAAKSTCKDRWPQILPEAERIPTKHLVTLEHGISESQTITMRDSGVQLIVPRPLQRGYTRDQCGWIWCLSDFVDLVSEKQSKAFGERVTNINE